MGYKVCVLGAGAWGLAIAECLRLKHSVLVWTHSQDAASILNQTKTSPRLPNVKLSNDLDFTHNLDQAVEGKDFIIIATASAHTEKVIVHLSKSLKNKEHLPVIGVLTKGFLEKDKNPVLILEALEALLPSYYQRNLVYISGPSHAEEVVRGVLTGLISSSFNARNAFWVRDLMMGPVLKVYPSLDPIGVQVAAALKNAYAIAFGILDALKQEESNIVGDNTESFLFSASLNEMQSFGISLGSTHPQTFSSIAGAGDLNVTCHSTHGRNRKFGRSIILDDSLKNFSGIQDLMKNSEKLGYTIEGISACYYGFYISSQKNIKSPILNALYGLLDKKIKPKEVLQVVFEKFINI